MMMMMMMMMMMIVIIVIIISLRVYPAYWVVGKTIQIKSTEIMRYYILVRGKPENSRKICSEKSGE